MGAADEAAVRRWRLLHIQLDVPPPPGHGAPGRRVADVHGHAAHTVQCCPAAMSAEAFKQLFARGTARKLTPSWHLWNLFFACVPAGLIALMLEPRRRELERAKAATLATKAAQETATVPQSPPVEARLAALEQTVQQQLVRHFWNGHQAAVDDRVAKLEAAGVTAPATPPSRQGNTPPAPALGSAY